MIHQPRGAKKRIQARTHKFVPSLRGPATLISARGVLEYALACPTSTPHRPRRRVLPGTWIELWAGGPRRLSENRVIYCGEAISARLFDHFR